MDLTSLNTQAAKQIYTAPKYLQDTLKAVNPDENKFLVGLKDGDSFIDASALQQSIETMFNLPKTAPDRLLDLNV